MSYKPHYTSGDWLAICDVCGRLYEASSLRQRWDGFMVCHQDFETRHPQDFVRGVIDKQTTPWVRDEGSDTFVTGICTTRTSIAGYAISGCALPKNLTSPLNVPAGTFNQ